MSVDDDLYEGVHRLARERGTSRSQVLREAARVLRVGGRLVATTLHTHAHKEAVAPFDHLQLGFAPEELARLAKAAGLQVELCQVTHEEKRAPHFQVLTLYAEKKRGRK